MELKNKKLITRIILIIFILGIGVGIYIRFFGEKKLQVISPNGGEEWRAGLTHQITWKARYVGKIGIMLVKDSEARESKWITKDIPASQGKYDWSVFVWEEPRQDYKIVVFEYPWEEDSKYDYSDNNFTILGPQFASCDSLSINSEWPHIPSDFPDLRRVFITKDSWSGDLEGLEGADKKCQESAEKENLSGNWKAFLGNDKTFIVDRLKLEGVFIEAKSVATLPEGKFCHRLLGKNFNEFFEKFSKPLIINQEKLEKSFLEGLSKIWIGRIDKNSKIECLPFAIGYDKKYSFTTTCQNWTTNKSTVAGYPQKEGEITEFPVCYTPEGVRIDAIGLAGLSSDVITKEDNLKYFSLSLGKSCNTAQKLLCIEQ